MARRKKRRHADTTFRQLDFQQFHNHLKPLEIISEDELEAIHRASLEVLSGHGIRFSLEEARQILQESGAELINDGLVRFDPELVMEYVGKAPKCFRLCARNRDHDLLVGEECINFSTVSSPPNSSDVERGRRIGSLEDFRDFLRLSQTINVAQSIGGFPVEPTDVAVPVRHLHATREILRLTDKTFRLYTHNRQQVLDVLEMVRIVHGLTEISLINEPRVFVSVNPNSPRDYDEGMLWGIIECAKAGQPIFITPFTLAGAMAPVSLAGALTLQNAEALAGIAFSQMVRSGTPVVYGGYSSNVDMKSGSPAFGTPEFVKTTLIGGQLARRYRLQYRTSNVNTSNVIDAQSIYESQMSLWASLLSQSNYVYHGLGWLEGGLTASFEKFIIDAEMIQGLLEVLRPVDVSDEELAVEAIGKVKPGGHFFGEEHTKARYEQAFYTPFLSDWRPYEMWHDKGALDATLRAGKIYKSILAEYQTPRMDSGIREELDEFVELREREGGAPVQ